MQNRVKRRCVALLVTAGLLAVPIAAPAAASPHRPDHASNHGHALVDRNRDHLSDGLDAKLSRADPAKRFDVVATFADRGSMRGARRDLGRVDTTFSLIPGFAARLTPGQVRSMAHRPGVLRVEQNFTIRALDDAANRDFGVTAAQNTYSATGAGTEVCVVDTGVDPNHEQLDSKMPIPWVDYINGSSTPYDDYGHGTSVASIAVGDGVGPGPIAGLMKGVAPAADLSAAKVLDATGSGDDSLGILGIQWCANRASVDVISLSLGSDVPSDGLDGLSQAVDAAVLNKGKIVVAAAGNAGDFPGTIASPGSAVQALTVGATADWSAPASAPYHAEGPYLAPFSSRGPTLDNRIKPDIVAPGVNIGSAAAGSVSDYVGGPQGTGTSFATPFVSGVAALLRQKQPGWTQANVRADIEGTAFDVGPSGKDNEWGAGLLDGYEAVAQAAGGSGQTSFPAYQRLTGSVADFGTTTKTFTLAAGDLGVPIAATITVDGAPYCVLDLGPLGCLLFEWNPDLDASLLDPNGTELDASTCAAGDECGLGRQETLHAMPTVAGTYSIRIEPFPGDPNFPTDHDGAGGSFAVDLFHGPGGTAPPPPPAPTVHIGDLDDTSALLATGWRAQVRILVEDQDRAVVPGAAVTGKWPNGSTGTCTT
ncbi:MAG: S8 family serine peptidase, partial [Actinomycetota bacterium]|nr:S8 family serine peptidase [Actinomycetota bacterium]